MSESDKYNQARRVLHAYMYIASNPNATLNQLTDFLFEDITPDERKSKNRSVQRIVDILVDEEFVEKRSTTKHLGCRYSILKKLDNINTKKYSQIKGSEVLAFHFVKAFMDRFKGTDLASAFDRLLDRINSISSDLDIPESELFNIVLPGIYEYGDNGKHLIGLLRMINERTWLKIKYQKQTGQSVKETEILPVSLYLYEGAVYLVAYNPRAKKFLSYSVYNILGHEEADNQNRIAPEFNPEEFRKGRFAVIDGEVTEVKITVKNDMAKYFENRNWHITQKISYDDSDNLILKFSSPLTPDLIGWILRWIEAVIDIEPKQLKDKVVERIKAGVKTLEG